MRTDTATLPQLTALYGTMSKTELTNEGLLLKMMVEKDPSNVELTKMLQAARNVYRTKFGKATSNAVAEAVTPPPATEPVTVEYRQPLQAKYADLPENKKPRPTMANHINWIMGQTFTVVFKDQSYVTVRFEKIETGNLAGKMMYSVLVGPDNETNFKGVGFINEYGTATIWNKQKGTTLALMAQEAAYVVISQPDDSAKFTEAYAMASGRCAKCGRKLTVPASLNRGYGPECYKMIGGE